MCRIVYDFKPGDRMARKAPALARDNVVTPLMSDRSAAVYAGLRRAIIEQALSPGDKLPEDTIGESFGVSRTLVRSALTRLAGEGLVEQRRNKGAAVASPSLASARDIFDVRRQLEDLVVQRLAGRLTSAQAATLRAHVERERSAQGRDGPESIRLAGEFHILLADMTGNALLARYIGEVASRSSLILALYGRPHSSDCAVNEHVQLIEALVAGRAAEARRLMEHHIGAVQERALIERASGGEQKLRKILDGYAQQVRAEDAS
jgi:DNA-binding GntR family transcriptional regulator